MVTALPLQPGMLNLTTGKHYGVRIVHCEADGALILWKDHVINETYNMKAGEDRFIDGFIATEVSTGTFTLSR